MPEMVNSTDQAFLIFATIIKHIRHTAGATIMEVGYGINVKSENDPYIHAAEEALNAAGEAGVPGRFKVDMIPWMKYIPEWVPGRFIQETS
ncbi:hypothetical protein M422DRAFT_260714 [Sphaerobolus stellatus SS14]|uniref:Unplaced genomic scaffold SPHSTscaffold_99, whole genome shotgun sequence n=1 Tax=Sphaerobolus stellatus (strain SS14) TaxID=990650 RepID=A0A0C9VH12_SPHS4|nr:hypothetical protein M422DRAFT_260714 [Sphaerobolus stellatus SS14]